MLYLLLFLLILFVVLGFAISPLIWIAIIALVIIFFVDRS